MTQKAITIKETCRKTKYLCIYSGHKLKDNPEISQQTRKTVQALAKELQTNPIAGL